MNRLDGDTNHLAGGNFDLRFNVLVGDANNDGSVNGGDLPSFATSFNRIAGDVAYNSRADWNSDKSVNGGDLPLFASNFNQTLPGIEPAALNFIAFALISDTLLAPPIDDIDDFFSRLESDEELMLIDDGSLYI
jgi:hypothetical protein